MVFEVIPDYINIVHPGFSGRNGDHVSLFGFIKLGQHFVLSHVNLLWVMKVEEGLGILDWDLVEHHYSVFGNLGFHLRKKEKEIIIIINR